MAPILLPTSHERKRAAPDQHAGRADSWPVPSVMCMLGRDGMDDATTPGLRVPATAMETDVSAESAAARWAVGAAAGSRLFLAAVAVVTSLTLGVAVRALYLRDPQHAEVLRGFAARLFEPWAHWDGVWFVRIAADGYPAHPASPAFFPLYPLLVRAASMLTGGNLVIAGVLVSLACYAGAMAVLYRLASEELGSRTALWTVVYISAFPTALFFQAVYSESLFLLLMLLCLSLARRSRWAPACVAGLLAALTRSTGLLLVIPLALIWWEQRRGCALRLPGGPAASQPSRAVSAWRPSRASFAWLLLVPAGLGLYMAYLWLQYGDPLAFSSAQRNWGRSVGEPFATAWHGALAFGAALRWFAIHGLSSMLVHTPSGGFNVVSVANLAEFLALVFAVLALVACWRRLPAVYTIYAAAALLFPLLYPSTGRPLSSLPRFVVVIFPLFMGVAAVLATRRIWRWVLLAVMLSILVPATVLFASFK
jgi:hypothetical protein